MVYQRNKNGPWYMRFIINGVLTNRSTQEYDKRAAKRVEEQARVAFREMRKQAPKTTLRAAIDSTHTDRWVNNKNASEPLARALKCGNFLGLDKDVKEFTTADIRGLKRYLGDITETPATANRYLAAIRTAFNHVADELQFRPPKFELFKETEWQIEVYSGEQESALLANLGAVGYSDTSELVSVLIDTGMRLGEILGINRQADNGNMITTFTGGRLTTWENKSSKSRSVPVTPRVSEILSRRMPGGSEVPFSETDDHYRHGIFKVEKLTGGELRRPFHNCRHTCATRLLSGGLSIKEVQEWLGHSSITVTSRYLHLVPGALQRGVEILSR